MLREMILPMCCLSEAGDGLGIDAAGDLEAAGLDGEL